MDILHQLFLHKFLLAALEDPLINSRAEQTVILMVWVIIFTIAGVVGIFSRRLSYAIVFALVSTIISMAFFLID